MFLKKKKGLLQLRKAPQRRWLLVLVLAVRCFLMAAPALVAAALPGSRRGAVLPL
jgi:hypothetical protein